MSPNRGRPQPIELDAIATPDAMRRARGLIDPIDLVPTSARRHFEEHGPQRRGEYADDVDRLVEDLEHDTEERS